MRTKETPEGRSVRLLRVGEQVRHVLSESSSAATCMTTTLQSHLVSVTEVRMSPDLRHATVFVKPLLGQDEEAVLKALRTHTAYPPARGRRPGADQICRQAEVPRRRELRRGHTSTGFCARPNMVAQDLEEE